MILNLTQHIASPEQIADGVVEPQNKGKVRETLTFLTLPSRDEIVAAAQKLADIAENARAEDAMIGGAPFLMAALEAELILRGIEPVYAFSQRVSVEDAATGRKTSVFKHLGFVHI